MPILNVKIRETHAVRNLLKADKIVPGTKTNDVKITDIHEIKGNKKDTSLLIFEFKYSADYQLKEPKDSSMGLVEVIGEIYFGASKDAAKKIMDTWKNENKIEENIFAGILNTALEKGHVEAIEQSAKVGLPLPVPLPRVKAPTSGKSKKSKKTSAS